MLATDLAKTIDRGNWRWIGQRVAGISPTDIPIGGISLPALLHHIGGAAFTETKEGLIATAANRFSHRGSR